MVIIVLDGKPSAPAAQLERHLLQMEDVLRELRGEPCPSCQDMHCTGGPEELAHFEVWLRNGCAQIPFAIEYLTSCIEQSVWAHEGYASVEAAQGHIARLKRLKDWNEGRLLEGKVTP